MVGSNCIEYTLPFCLRELELSSRTCAFCSLIKEGVESTCRDPGSFHREGNDSPINRRGRIIVQKSAPLEVELNYDESSGRETVLSRLQFFVADKDGENGGMWLESTISASGHFGALGIARKVAPSISVRTHTTLIDSWIANCLHNHPSCNISSASQLPTRLLDISKSTEFIYLVETRHLPISIKWPSYATLSHCWGFQRFIQTTSSSLESFYNGIRRSTLPPTFRDAVSIVRALGLRFIWIDSLCIVQDSPEDWKHESTLMASIYSNSYVNIAATGAADNFKGCLAPRKLIHQSIPISTKGLLEPEQEDKAVFVRTSLDDLHKYFSTPTILRSEATNLWEREKKEAPLLLRAWVFQERYLAPRTLHFCSSELVMECRQELRCECTGLDSKFNPLRDMQNISYDNWFRAVEDFSRLRLSYETDRLIAMMGVAKVFHARLMSTYLQGIWAEDLVRGLLWDITRYESHHTRESNFSLPRKRQSIEVAPTWSWASMVMTEGMGIIFPTAHDGSFSRNPRFRLLNPDLISTTSPTIFTSNTFSEMKAICVSSESFYATVFAPEKEDGNTVLVFDEDIDEMVLISTCNINLDINTGSGVLQPCEVCCLLLGSMIETDYELDQRTEFFCTLVVKPSSVVHAWERIGVIDIRKDNVNTQNIIEREFNLV